MVIEDEVDVRCRLNIDIPGFVSEPKRTAGGSIYRGRVTLPAVQWTGKGSERFATFTATLEEIADAAESRVLWTDQAVQRGITPAAVGAPRELPVGDGYPGIDYIFDARNADQITDKLLSGGRLFLSPLVWNLRPRDFEAYWDGAVAEIYLYSGKVYLPDSHHRHQAILKAVRAYRDSPRSYPSFDPTGEVKVELYFLSRADEGNYFFDKNQRPKPTALSKAFDLTTEDDLSVLAKSVLDRMPQFGKGVNRATDRLSKRAPHFVTLSTLREMMRLYAGTNEVDETEMEGLATIATDFLTELALVRPELRVETKSTEREHSLASSAVMFAGYAALLRAYDADRVRLGSHEAHQAWQEKLGRLAPDVAYSYAGWSGDYLSKENPLWSELGVTRVDKESGKVNVTNTGGSRSRAGAALRERVKA